MRTRRLPYIASRRIKKRKDCTASIMVSCAIVCFFSSYKWEFGVLVKTVHSLNFHKEKLHRRFTIQKESFSLFFPTTIHSVQKGGKKCTGALVRERKFHQKTSFVLCADATIFACQRHQRVDDDHCDDDYLLVCFCY